MSAPVFNRRLLAMQSPSSSTTSTDIPGDVPHKPSSALKKKGWSGLMREVSTHGILVVTHRNKPEAVVLSVERYQALARLAEREKLRGEQQLAELSARFDQRLAALKTPQARQALDAFMDEPLVLNGQLRAGTAY